MEKLKKSQSSLSDVDIEDMFAKIQKVRSPRTKALFSRAATFQSILSQQSPILKLFFPLMLRTETAHANLEQFSHPFYNGARLEIMDIPKRSRAIPFTDELPAKPRVSVRFPKVVAMVLLAVLAYLAVKAIRLVPVDIPTFAGNRMLLKTKYTGLPPLDEVLCIMVSAFSYLLAADDPAVLMQLTYFLSTLTPVFMIWTIESYRLGRRWWLISL